MKLKEGRNLGKLKKFYFKYYEQNLKFKIILLSLDDISFIVTFIYTYIYKLCICEMCSLELLIKLVFPLLIHLKLKQHTGKFETFLLIISVVI